MTMHDELSKIVLTKVLDKLDLSKIAEEMQPQIEQEIRKGILRSLRDLEWTDLLYDQLDMEKIGKAISAKMIATLK